MPNHVISRRDLLQRALLAAASLATAGTAFAGQGASGRLTVPFGAAVRSGALDADAAYRVALAAYCQVIVPEGELKWSDLRPTRGEYRFEKADRIAAFAREQGLALRGHTLAWYGAMPAWTEEIATRAEAERELTTHIQTVVSRYRGTISSWDVVNEPIPDKPWRVSDLRPFVWSRLLGSDYLALAFKAAAQADPGAMLVLNEYDVEFVGWRYRARREALRHIVRKLLDQNVPIHAVGLQAHLGADREIDRDGIGAFVAEMRSLGLKILITELDVADKTLPADEAARDAGVAAKANEFLDAVFAGARPEAIITWGLSDRYTWVPTYFKRDDGLPNRPLPLDEAMRPKPLMTLIERYCRRPA